MYLFLIETFILEQDDPLERNYSIMEKINTDFFERTLDNEIYVRLCFVTLNKFQNKFLNHQITYSIKIFHKKL